VVVTGDATCPYDGKHEFLRGVGTNTYLCDRSHISETCRADMFLEYLFAAFPTEASMDEIHNYRIKAWWTSGRTGIANCDSAPNAIHFTAPLQFGGLEGRWTPEDLLLTAIGSCFATTFRALADYSQLSYTDLEVEVAGTVQKASSGYTFEEIITRPLLTTDCENDQERALRLLNKTQELCLVSRALSVRHTFEPIIRTNKTSKPTPTASEWKEQ